MVFKTGCDAWGMKNDKVFLYFSAKMYWEYRLAEEREYDVLFPADFKNLVEFELSAEQIKRTAYGDVDAVVGKLF